ncbi:LytR/AlgR family response regulator transcription factor [Rubrivirga sp.]|uniref:LytR/AlgR family response regulator transcription factor n=1 Tax=Rubrivirga sp. TaxID=1885344 RepID=UPI003C76EC8A
MSAVSCPSEISGQTLSTRPDLVYVGLGRSAPGWSAALFDLQQEDCFAGAVTVVDACRSPERLIYAFNAFAKRSTVVERSLSWDARLAVPVANRIALVKVGDICWIEGAGKYVRIHTRGKVYLLRELLQDLEVQLDSSKFIRIHRSTIVNVDCIATLEHAGRGEYIVHLGDGAELKLTRSYRSHLHTLTGGLVGDPPPTAQPRD